jgi:hypothetical protein
MSYRYVSGLGLAILICAVNCHVAKKIFNGTQLHPLPPGGLAAIMQNMPA